MRVQEIKRACNALLLQAFPNYRVYGNDSHDGYIRPAFFTELLPRAYARQSKCAVNAAYTYKITFLESTHDEDVCLGIVDTVMQDFGYLVACGSEYLLTQEIDYDWIDSNHDVLQITIDFAPFTVIIPPDFSDVPLMKYLELAIYLKPGDFEIKNLIQLIKDGKIHFSFSPDGALDVETADQLQTHVDFSIDGDTTGHLKECATELLASFVTFTVDSEGHLIATVDDAPDRITERFEVIVDRR